jgi:FAD-linked sulfhydryl oxidase
MVWMLVDIIDFPTRLAGYSVTWPINSHVPPLHHLTAIILHTPNMSLAGPLRTTKETHPNLPPGLILDAEGKVCKVCNSWQDWGKMRVKKKDQSSVASSSTLTPKNTIAGLGGFGAMMGRKQQGVPVSSTPDSLHTPQELDRTDCPADTALLGRSTWTFLHTTAAYYPLKAPISSQRNMRALLGSLATLYPCAPCAEDFRGDMALNPPDVSGREGLMRWLCERHNEVNAKLGKEVFACEVKSLDERWKDGPVDGRCD